MSYYKETREHLFYMSYIRQLLSVISLGKKSILDVGSNGMDTLSMTSCLHKVSIDINNPFIHEGIKSIKADFLKYNFKEKFDIVTCLQVIEHIADRDIKQFCQKLLKLSSLLVVSVPYRWEKELCKEHLQDPINLSKLVTWFGDEPKFVDVITDNYMCRLVAIFFLGKNYHHYKNYVNYIDNIYSSRFDKQTIDHLIDINAQLSSKIQNSNLSIQQLLSKIESTHDIGEKIKIYDEAIKIYPYYADTFGHPLFFKEKIRFLLENNMPTLAEKLYKTDEQYNKLYKDKQLHILFRRKGINI